MDRLEGGNGSDINVLKVRAPESNLKLLHQNNTESSNNETKWDSELNECEIDSGELEIRKIGLNHNLSAEHFRRLAQWIFRMHELLMKNKR